MIWQGILPIFPGMCAGALGVFVWCFVVQKAAVQFAVRGYQEVIYTTIEFDGQPIGLHFIRHIHHRVVVVEGWIFRFGRRVPSRAGPDPALGPGPASGLR